MKHNAAACSVGYSISGLEKYSPGDRPGLRMKARRLPREGEPHDAAPGLGAIHSSSILPKKRQCLRSDNGPEFVSKALLSWIVAQGIDTALIEPGKPWQNGVAESFNGKFRDECLSLEWFRSSSVGAAITTKFARTRASATSRRTSSWLNEQTQRPVMQRAGSLRYRGLRAPARCVIPPARGTWSKQGTPSQANRGPKKQGRSRL